MKKTSLTLALSLFIFIFSFTTSVHAFSSPLEGFSDAWKDEKYDAANTARKELYMSATERLVIQILNLARMNPALFERSVVRQYPDYKRNARLKQSPYYKSLSATLSKLEAMPILVPSQVCFESAKCHAETSGSKAYVGHARLNDACRKALSYAGECIAYGYNDALDIVMALLIDENVPDLSHRVNFLGNFKTIGVSIQPHKTYRYNAVIDFGN